MGCTDAKRWGGWSLGLALLVSDAGCGESPAPDSPRLVRTAAQTAPRATAAPSGSVASGKPAPAALPTPSALPAPTPSAEARPAPLADAGKNVALAVKGFDPAVVAVPSTGTPPHRVAIAAHANWDRPSWECDYWKRLLTDWLILCPRGIVRPDSPAPDDPRFTYKDDAALEAEVNAGMTALAERYGNRAIVSPPTLWVGLSRGSFLGAHIAVRDPKRYPALILVEGGHDPWTPDACKKFADGGGRRVHFVCGQGACTYSAKKAAKRLEHFGVATRLDVVPGMGHGLNYDADTPITSAFPWLLETSEPAQQ